MVAVPLFLMLVLPGLSLNVALPLLQVVYTMCNPRDAMVSGYHFFQGFKDLKDSGTMEVYLERFLSGEGMKGGTSASLICSDPAQCPLPERLSS